MKKWLLLVLLVILLFSFQLFVTYSLFESKTEQEVNSNLAKWNIKINNDIVTGDSHLFLIEDLVIENGSNVTDNKFAPGSRASFDIIIDCMDSEVSIRYDIIINLDELENKEIKLENISLADGTNLVKTSDNTYTGVISLSDIENGVLKDVKVSLIWNNNEDNSKIDYDTQSNSNLQIPVKVDLSQYLNEEIIAIDS